MFKLVFHRGLRQQVCLRTLVLIAAGVLLGIIAARSFAQTYEREIPRSGKSLLTIKNRHGRVTVIASDAQKDKLTLQAASPGAPVEPGDISASSGEISVRERRPQDRIDLTVRVTGRARVKIEGESGMVDVIGDFEVADVITNTGTIHAEVPLDALRFKFLWQSSRPRFLSDVQLPPIKEGHAGSFTIAGTVGPDAKRSRHKKKTESDNPTNDGADTKALPDKPVEPAPDDAEKPPAKQELVQLNFITQRGVILLNVDPSMAPNDLRDRPLTEAARPIMPSGKFPLSHATTTLRLSPACRPLAVCFRRSSTTFMPAAARRCSTRSVTSGAMR